MQLEVVSPERVLLKGEAKSVVLPGVDGKFQILNHHAPIISVLAEGKLRIEMVEELDKKFAANFEKLNGKEVEIDISGGVLEMNNNKAIVLID